DQAQWPLPTPKQPARSLVGIEVAVHENTVFIDGRIAQERWENAEYEEFPHFPSIVCDAYKEAGYNEDWGPDPNKLEIIQRVCLEYLSGDEASIRPYSDDQNIVIGYANARPETNHLPPAHWLAHHIGNRVLEFRKSSPRRFGPDFKVLVDITDDGGVIACRKLVLSIQHAQGIDMEDQHRTFLPFLAEALSDVEKSGLAGAGSSFSPSHLHLNGGGDFDANEGACGFLRCWQRPLGLVDDAIGDGVGESVRVSGGDIFGVVVRFHIGRLVILMFRVFRSSQRSSPAMAAKNRTAERRST
ncbi:MAG: hypothetical protein ACKOEZ_02210, partial [Spartobacteria bacterium]